MCKCTVLYTARLDIVYDNWRMIQYSKSWDGPPEMQAASLKLKVRILLSAMVGEQEYLTSKTSFPHILNTVLHYFQIKTHFHVLEQYLVLVIVIYQLFSFSFSTAFNISFSSITENANLLLKYILVLVNYNNTNSYAACISKKKRKICLFSNFQVWHALVQCF